MAFTNAPAWQTASATPVERNTNIDARTRPASLQLLQKQRDTVPSSGRLGCVHCQNEHPAKESAFLDPNETRYPVSLRQLETPRMGSAYLSRTRMLWEIKTVAVWEFANSLDFLKHCSPVHHKRGSRLDLIGSDGSSSRLKVAGTFENAHARFVPLRSVAEQRSICRAKTYYSGLLLLVPWWRRLRRWWCRCFFSLCHSKSLNETRQHSRG